MLKNLIIAAAIACSACFPAKDASADDEQVYSAECEYVAAPAPIVETFVVRPGYIWSRGYWGWSVNRWVWSPGYHVRIVAGYRWIHPRYTYVHRRWAFARGHWVR
jgi:hypothetical protein